MTRGDRRRSVVERHKIESEKQDQRIQELQLTITNLQKHIESCASIEAEVISDDGSIMPSTQLDAVAARGRVEQLPGHTEELEQRLYAEKDHTIQQLKMQLAHELEEASTSRRELAETRETLGRERAEMEYKVQQLEEQVVHAVEEVNSVKKEFSEARKAWTQEQESSAFALADLKIEAQQRCHERDNAWERIAALEKKMESDEIKARDRESELQRTIAANQDTFKVKLETIQAELERVNRLRVVDIMNASSMLGHDVVCKAVGVESSVANSSHVEERQDPSLEAHREVRVELPSQAQPGNEGNHSQSSSSVEEIRDFMIAGKNTQNMKTMSVTPALPKKSVPSAKKRKAGGQGQMPARKRISRKQSKDIHISFVESSSGNTGLRITSKLPKSAFADFRVKLGSSIEFSGKLNAKGCSICMLDSVTIARWTKPLRVEIETSDAVEFLNFKYSADSKKNGRGVAQSIEYAETEPA